MTGLTVENVHTMSSRPWVFVTGHLEGEPLHIGDRLSVVRDGIPTATVVVRSIELHSARTTTTVALDGADSGSISEGDVLRRPSS
ncbi:hypothetical protein [Actinoplanes sp. URMC 104]|uniref:hypothetical protein n=1 Tax=Actinoplanes sp. URMC 104 TaxID=3423409 RepID=UPI003F1CAAC3